LILKEKACKHIIYRLLSFSGVELQGVEPWSKQAAKVLSTCLAFSWFSGRDRQKATLSHPYSFWLSGSHQDLNYLSAAFAMLRSGRGCAGLPGEQSAARSSGLSG